MHLPDLLANRRWLRREHPVPHVWASDVFQPAVYADMAAAFQSLLERGLSDSYDPGRLSRSISGYDAYAIALTRALPAPLHVFTSRAWHDAIAAVTGVPATGDLNGALHHHHPGSLSGRPHTDLNPGWFIDQATDDVNISDESLCSYHTGHSPAGLPTHESVRGAAVLFYLANPPWSPGDGGETGLYDSGVRRTDEPNTAVPPINNSLLVFECTPRSYHAFIRNRTPRNSIVLWIHRSKADAVQRFGASSIVDWQGAPVLNEVSR